MPRLHGRGEGDSMHELNFIVLLAGVVAGAAPLVFAVLGETLTEKAGVINLSLDGTLLLSAMVAFAVTYETGSLLLGFGAAALTGTVVAAVVGIAGIFLGQSQLAVGFVLTLMCRDLAYFLGNPFARLHGLQVLPLPVPLLNELPVLGPILFHQNVLVYLNFLLIGLVWFYMYGTRWGLELRAVGEHPQAAYARGISVRRLQMLYVLAGGALVGVAGAAFSLCTKPGWGRPQGAEGMGWIALAIVIFGGWHPVKVACGAYLFAWLQMMGISFQNQWPSIPAQVFQVAPFPLMIFVLLLMHFSQKRAVEQWAENHPWLLPLIRFFQGTAPASLGQPARKRLGS